MVASSQNIAQHKAYCNVFVGAKRVTARSSICAGVRPCVGRRPRCLLFSITRQDATFELSAVINTCFNPISRALSKVKRRI